MALVGRPNPAISTEDYIIIAQFQGFVTRAKNHRLLLQLMLRRSRHERGQTGTILAFLWDEFGLEPEP